MMWFDSDHLLLLTDQSPAFIQVIEALTYLQYNCNIIHRNICPQSILINAKGTWKLAGFHFYEKCAETEITVSAFIQSSVPNGP